METIETVFKLEQGTTIPGRVIQELANYENGHETDFEMLGLECEVYYSKGIDAPDFKSPPEFDVHIDFNEDLHQILDVNALKHVTGLEHVFIKFDTVLRFRTNCKTLNEEGTNADPKVCLNLIEFAILFVNELKKESQNV